MDNPYEPPVDARETTRPSPGIGRLTFFILSFGVYFFALLIFTSVAFPVTGWMTQSFYAFFFIAMCALVALRLRNIGVSPTLAFLLFVPIVNLFLYVFCLSYPTDAYEGDRLKLDATGRRLVVAMGLGLVVIIGGVVVCTALVLQSLGR